MANSLTWEITVKIKLEENRGQVFSKDIVEYLIRKDLGWASELDSAYLVERVDVETIRNVDTKEFPY